MAKNLHWVNPTKREDGSDFAASEEAGVKVQVDGKDIATLPGSSTSFDLSTVPGLAVGTHTAGVAAVDTGGLVSDFGTATFPVLSTARPLAPSDVGVD